ncbi:MAG: hypothetical protein ACE10D_10350 [Planctomycetota bacterium]
MRTVAVLVVCATSLAACGGGGSGGGGSGGGGGKTFATLVNSNLAIAGRFDTFVSIGNTLLVTVSERESQQDLNNDGDMLDAVAHLVDTTTDTNTNLRLAVVGPMLSSGTHFAFLVPEGGPGGTDLNGDGDFIDASWHLLDPAQGTPVNLAIMSTAAPQPAVGTAGGFVFLEAESAVGADATADGDTADNIFVEYALATGQTARIPFAHATGTSLVARSGRVLVLASEAAMSNATITTDFNGDGDGTDMVLLGFDFTQGGLSAAIPIGPVGPRSVAAHPYALTDNAAVYMVDEATEAGFDFNGDGDNNDAIVAVFDFRTRLEAFAITPGGLIPAAGVAGAPQLGIATSATRAVLALRERDNVNLGAAFTGNLNGDLDSLDDVVVWIDTTVAPPRVHIPPLGPDPGLAVSTIPPAINGLMGVVAADEAAQGGPTGVMRDFNGDVDTADRVAFRIDTSTVPGTFTSLGLAVTGFSLSGTDLLVTVSESDHGPRDLNMDGDTLDAVVHYLDLADFVPAPRNLIAVPTSLSFFRFGPAEIRIGVLLVEGQSPTFGDLNGNGVNDNAITLLGVNPSFDPPGAVSNTPFFAGTGGLGSSAPLRAGGNVFAFPTAETMEGADLNGDSDTADTVLRYVRYAPP